TSVAPGYRAAMPLMRDYAFTAGGSLSSAPGAGEVYALTPGATDGSLLTRAASVLGVDVGAPTSTDGQNFTSSSSSYTGWLSVLSGYTSWGLSAVNQPNPSSTIADSATNAFDARALAYAAQLGGDLGSPSDAALGADPAGPVEVTVPILVDSLTTPFTYDFEFAADGTLLGADGVSFSTTAQGNYPLVSPVDGVTLIPSQYFLVTNFVTEGFVAPFATADGSSSGVVPSPTSPSATGGSPAPSPGSPTPSTVATSSSDSPPTTIAPPVATPPIATPPVATPPDVTPDTTPTTVAPTNVTVTSVTTEYSVFSMANGSTLLLPIYVYTGDVDGGGTATFSIVPIDPSYLDLSQITRVMMF
ncbi:MAG: hypothetical protein ACRDV0_06525, partial [Acidimicrobiales bacterium]